MKKQGKWLIFFMALTMLTGCQSGGTYQAGTYEGTGQGYNDQVPIKVSVTIAEDHSIYEIKVLEHAETDTIGGKALDALCEEAKKKNTTEVETVSGATRTSTGFREAVKNALSDAKK